MLYSPQYPIIQAGQLINEAVSQFPISCKVGKQHVDVFYLLGICTQVVIDHWFYIP